MFRHWVNVRRDFIWDFRFKFSSKSIIRLTLHQLAKDCTEDVMRSVEYESAIYGKGTVKECAASEACLQMSERLLRVALALPLPQLVPENLPLLFPSLILRTGELVSGASSPSPLRATTRISYSTLCTRSCTTAQLRSLSGAVYCQWSWPKKEMKS